MAIWGNGDIEDIKQCADMAATTDATTYFRDTKGLIEFYKLNWPNQIKDCIPQFRSIQVSVCRLDVRINHNFCVLSKWMSNWVQMHSSNGKSADNPVNYRNVIAFIENEISILQQYHNLSKDISEQLKSGVSNSDERQTLRKSVLHLANILEDMEIADINSVDVLAKEVQEVCVPHSFSADTSSNNSIKFLPTNGNIITQKNILVSELKNAITNEDRLNFMLSFCNKFEPFTTMLEDKCTNEDWWSRGKNVQFILNQNTKKYVKYVISCCRCYHHHFSGDCVNFLESYSIKKMILIPTNFRTGCHCSHS